jgi:hypothetical protein
LRSPWPLLFVLTLWADMFYQEVRDKEVVECEETGGDNLHVIQGVVVHCFDKRREGEFDAIRSGGQKLADCRFERNDFSRWWRREEAADGANVICWDSQRDRESGNSQVLAREVKLDQSHGYSWGFSLNKKVYAAI